MKNFITKNALAAFVVAAILSVSSANAAEFALPVSIDQVGKLKFLVSSENNSPLFVVIYDEDNNQISRESLSAKKLFNFSNLNDGLYKMVILDSRKNIIKSKTFNILTETRRDLIAIQ
ncbi:hypothetical protein [Aquirufa sp. Wall-65K1]